MGNQRGGLALGEHLFAGIRVDGLGWAFIAALFLGIFNAVIRRWSCC